jgi:hypothetical protein
MLALLVLTTGILSGIKRGWSNHCPFAFFPTCPPCTIVVCYTNPDLNPHPGPYSCPRSEVIVEVGSSESRHRFIVDGDFKYQLRCDLAVSRIDGQGVNVLLLVL